MQILNNPLFQKFVKTITLTLTPIYYETACSRNTMRWPRISQFREHYPIKWKQLDKGTHNNKTLK